MPWYDEHKYKDPTDYEYKTAEKLNARRSINSGALFGDFDVQSSEVLIDNKRVSKGHTYRLDIRDFNNVKKKSKFDQIPAMLINYDSYGQSVAVIREEDFIGLIEIVRDLTKDVD